MELLSALEASGFSMWVKESSTAYVAILAFHTIGLVFLVGISGITALRIIGIFPSLPLRPMQGFFPLMWVGLGINAVTGLLLICLYPTNYFVDPSFYIKLACVATAVVIIVKLIPQVFAEGLDSETVAKSESVRRSAKILLFVWLVATVTGRVIAYSIDTKVQTGIAVAIVLVLALIVGRLIGPNLGLLEWPKDRTENS